MPEFRKVGDHWINFEKIVRIQTVPRGSLRIFF
jgi:hypothetical protein